METNGTQRAFVRGPTDPPIYSKTFGQLIDEQAATYGKKPAILSPWQGISLSYDELAQRSKHVAKALLGMGMAHGDCVGIMAGNSCQHIEVLMGGARIGCPVVSLHSTYTPEELKRAVQKTSCRLLFIASSVGRRDLSAHVEMAKDCLSSGALPNLRGVLTIGQIDYDGYAQGLHTYEALFSEYKEGVAAPDVDAAFLLDLAEKAVTPDDVVRLDFTSGTTGNPKAGMSTATNLLGCGFITGDCLSLTPNDIACSPAPLFHAFTFIVGLLAPLTHGCSIVLPSDHFSTHKVLEAIQKQEPTLLLGVPAMFLAEVEAMAKEQTNTSLRAAVVGGSAMTSGLIKTICDVMAVKEVFVVYGMMETGATFMGSFNGSEESTGMVGRVMPHICAKVLNESGHNVRRMEKGELYTSGYSLQKGYFDDEEKTLEGMPRDNNGRIWMRTGDEAVIDEGGCCHITGRIKDIIIRGGENISPLEVESRLASHPSISEASVFGLPDTKYGEVVGCFLKCAPDAERPSKDEVQSWVRTTLAWHKTPVHIFWIGDPGVADDFPRTGSGKHQKHIMKIIGERLIAARGRAFCDPRLMCELRM
ncbi:AMP dependent ligase/synthetase [Aspergillus bombycis]|uniref:AMP dependent ligase/synthetase n=1 Tax=Aspergillus bombycis TaxID=109264 RepID=A0A1F7ZXB0_9EURO|nr:AMP dependent ligase/synthetase [Aspergillus bombycis]OGM44080.1 AMP dependent ligase/synthetase [Aspergillus bombycis]